MYEDSIGPIAPIIWIIFILILYVYTAYSTQVIARKLGVPNGWLAWIPIANLFLLLKLAGKSYWLFILLIIPLVNIIVSAFIWKDIAVRRGHSKWWGLGSIIPVVNLVMPGYIAFVDKTPVVPPQTTQDYQYPPPQPGTGPSAGQPLT